jgi:hypothetical protein
MNPWISMKKEMGRKIIESARVNFSEGGGVL